MRRRIRGAVRTARDIHETELGSSGGGKSREHGRIDVQLAARRIRSQQQGSRLDLEWNLCERRQRDIDADDVRQACTAHIRCERNDVQRSQRRLVRHIECDRVWRGGRSDDDAHILDHEDHLPQRGIPRRLCRDRKWSSGREVGAADRTGNVNTRATRG